MAKKKESEINRLFKKKGTSRRPTFPVEKHTNAQKKDSKKRYRSSSSSTPHKVPLLPTHWEISHLRDTSEQLLKKVSQKVNKRFSNYSTKEKSQNRYTRDVLTEKNRVESLSSFLGSLKERVFTKEVIRLMLVEPFTVRSIIDNFDYESVEGNNRDKERIRRIAKKLVETKVLYTRTIGPGIDGIETHSFLRNTQLYWFEFHTKDQFETTLEYYRFKGKQFRRRVKTRKTKEGEKVKERVCEYCHEPITPEQDYRYHNDKVAHTTCLRSSGIYIP